MDKTAWVLVWVYVILLTFLLAFTEDKVQKRLKTLEDRVIDTQVSEEKQLYLKLKQKYEEK